MQPFPFDFMFSGTVHFLVKGRNLRNLLTIAFATSICTDFEKKVQSLQNVNLRVYLRCEKIDREI